MDVAKVNFQDIFGQEIHYIIPVFQRHYVWSEDGQWSSLWEDIETHVNKHMHEIQSGQQPQSGQLPHFTGAIVIQQKPSNINEISAYEIIDGQQRLITFQLILCAIRDVCNELGGDFTNIANDAERYIFNIGRNIQPETTKFKLMPRYDRLAFKEILKENIPQKGNIYNAYRYFKDKINGLIKTDFSIANILFDTVIKDFNIVQILIGNNEQPEIIFESLNARSEPLLQFDLLRNNLFLRAPESRKDDLYEKYWAYFEQSFWGKEYQIRTHKRTLSELFLQHFLVVKLTAQNVSPLFQNYNKYRKSLGSKITVESELKELRRCAEVYREMTNRENTNDIGKRMRVYNTLDITSLRPFVLYLLAETKSLSHAKKMYVLDALESYAIRRLFCMRLAKNHFNVFFANIIKVLDGHSAPLFRTEIRSKITVEQILKKINSSDAGTDKWPQNCDVAEAISGKWVTNNVKKITVRYILYRIEQKMQERQKELKRYGQDVHTEVHFNQDLTLEHIMPQQWKTYWPSSSSDAIVGKHIQNIGNLTLLTTRGNAYNSNKNFGWKKQFMNEHSDLLLNRELCLKENWDVEDIKSRSNELHEIFCEIWPDADWFLDNIPD